MNTSKVHINNMYIKYTFVHFAILLIRQVFGAVPLPVTISFAVEQGCQNRDSVIRFYDFTIQTNPYDSTILVLRIYISTILIVNIL